MRRQLRLAILSSALSGSLCATAATAAEVHVGDPVTRNGLSVAAAYLTGIEMEPAPPTPHGGDTIHLECDVSAAADNAHGFSEGSFVPYLTCSYLITKQGSDWQRTGTMLPMTAKDGPHYANNVRMDGPGTYEVTYVLAPPSRNGFFRHADSETGVPEWWEPFSVRWTFDYPADE